MVNSRTGAENIQDKPRLSCRAKNKRSAQIEIEDSMLKRHQCQLEELPMAKDGTTYSESIKLYWTIIQSKTNYL